MKEFIEFIAFEVEEKAALQITPSGE